RRRSIARRDDKKPAEDREGSQKEKFAAEKATDHPPGNRGFRKAVRNPKKPFPGWTWVVRGGGYPKSRKQAGRAGE
ncbi:MAG TPA: hypothetical protein PKI05_09305, partial [Thermogutta sp.]|nr:hypothetical protein [Thermogutta sp.]